MSAGRYFGSARRKVTADFVIGNSKREAQREGVSFGAFERNRLMKHGKRPACESMRYGRVEGVFIGFGTNEYFVLAGSDK
jgi:hypothetical protein